MKYSVLDLAYLREGQSFKEAYDDQLELAKAVETFGYERFWIAEHHNSRGIGSSATALLIERALAHTDHMRIGSGGVMLPNHSPYLVAEEYGTLETLYPGRVDLGLGRAPGTDLVTAAAIRRTGNLYPDFRKDVSELTSYFEDTSPFVHAYPAAGFHIPLYILGSSTDSAYLASDLGLPYSFASHFAPAAMEDAIEIYRSRFKPSKVLDKPYVILGVNAIVADTDMEAERLATSHLQAILGIITNRRQGILPPKENEETVWADYIAAEKVPHFGPVAFDNDSFIGREKEVVDSMTAVSLNGSKEAFALKLNALREIVEFEEIIVNCFVYDQEARINSYRLVAEVMKEQFSE